MARIPEAEIERLKNEVAVERLVEASGIELKKSGKDRTGRCPFHEDDTASLVITPAKNLWHCFGCGLGGGPIDWMMKKNGISFRHAVELLRDGVSTLAAGSASLGGATKRSTVRALPMPLERDADDVQLLNQVTNYYHETLKRNPEAQAYLASRGLDNTDAIAHFKLGYANRTLGLRLPNKQRKEGLVIRTRLERLGVMRETSGHEHLAGSLIVPILDAAGNTVNLYGRKITKGLRPGTTEHLYLPRRDGLNPRGVWNLGAFAASREIIICEALIDALTFWCAGYRNVSSAYGTDGFSDEMLAVMQQHGTQRVLIAYDRDAAGDLGAPKLAERLMAAGIECFRIQFPKGMDANEYAQKVTPAQRSLGLVIRKALWMGKGAAPAPTADTLSAIPMLESMPDAEPPSAVVATPPPVVDIAERVAVLPPLAADTGAAPIMPDASPVPPPPDDTVHAAVTDAPKEVPLGDSAVHFTFGERRYRVRGLPKNVGGEIMKVNLLVARGDAFFVDTFDLYSARQRLSFITQAALELQLTDDIVRADVGRVLKKLEDLQEAALQKGQDGDQDSVVALSAEEQAEALALLRAPDLLARIGADFDTCGLVGETTNKRVAYLAAVSRLLDAPLAIVVQSSSAAGKSALMDAVLAFMPKEDYSKYSAMTGQSLFYMSEMGLQHKILAIAEEEGASRATYALKLLQSEGELTIASTGKNPTTGNLETQPYRVEGPVMIFLTTTAIEIDEELLNRCIVLSVDEGRAQTEAIHQRQRAKRTLAGLAAKQEKTRLTTLHQNAQRLLRPLAVVNPYADQLTFLSDKTRTRRDHEKYLTLIDSIALLHQHQREVRQLTGRGHDSGGVPLEYIEVTLSDIAAANAMAHEVLGRSLDELPPQTRRLLNALAVLVRTQGEARSLARSEFRFTRRDVREATGWSDTQLRVHLDRLAQMEYLIVHRGSRGQTFEYELLYDGDGTTEPHLSGLLDPATMSTSRGESRGYAAPTRGQNAPNAGPSRRAESAATPELTRVSAPSFDPDPKTHVYCTEHANASQTHAAPSVSPSASPSGIAA